MPFEIVEESLDVARDDAIAVLDATRQHAVDRSRFQWLYCDNPDGPAVLWAIRKTETGEMAGFTVALPRRMLVDGQLRHAWNGADFSILPRFRTLGLALKLRRAAKNGVDDQRVDFLYAHPNEKMAVIHAKVGHSPIGEMVRYAKVLRTAPYIQRKVGNNALATVGGAMLDPLLRIAGAETRHRAKCNTSLMDITNIDERFDKLFANAAPARGVIGVRDSRYLRWRYAENPLETAQVIIAEENGQLCGYLVMTTQQDMGVIKDLFPMDRPEVARDLLATAIRQGRKQGLNSLSFTMLCSNPLVSSLVKFGFRQRSGLSQMYGYAPESSELRATLLDVNAWWLTVGDRDV
ncbi:hypothetical protein Pan258_04530 [Symmachiella dynata]|uniref:hypothetical protein n=1 Tax=Symmachiella dynata TaxID=2527995 RepID=UPI00118A9777|nr:hypothetical protein [Symmachiella dynata]QDT46434.1 hypothetical protein Pan258_04530 [Symmachiella dynata]